MLHTYTAVWMFSSNINNFLTVLTCKWVSNVIVQNTLKILYVYLYNRYGLCDITRFSRDVFIPTMILLGYGWFDVFALG
jgi:hypothetical protein